METGHYVRQSVTAINKGFSLVELLVTVAVMGLVFGGLFSAFGAVISYTSNNKAKAGAIALATERVEYIRSLPYDEVGTVSGVPAGSIPQLSTFTLNGIDYEERVLVQYFDAPDDGEGAADSNGILADYKLVKVTIAWGDGSPSKSITMISNVVPRGIETTAGGGTITVNVFDASALPVPGASVRFVNNTLAPTIDTTRFSDVSGRVIFSGAPAGSNYQIEVTDTGYSTDSTYASGPSNPNPVTPEVSVIESEVSTMNFQIDELSDLTVRVVTPPSTATDDDDFDDLSGLSGQDSVAAAGALELFFDGLEYAVSGWAESNVISPGPIGWEELSFTLVTPAGTAGAVYVYYDTGSGFALVPDAILPGNSTGLTISPVSLRALDPAVYADLRLRAELSTTDVSVTPAVDDWAVEYANSANPLSGADLLVTGSKIIGREADLTPIYKYSGSHTTDGSGEAVLSGIEWDQYEIALTETGYMVGAVCEPLPHILNPGANDTVELTAVPEVTPSLLVLVVDGSGLPVPGATVRLRDGGFDETLITPFCGSVLFSSGLAEGPDYTLTVSAPGFSTEEITGFSVADEAGYVTMTINP